MAVRGPKMAVVARVSNCQVCGEGIQLVDVNSNGEGGQWVHISEYGPNPHSARPAGAPTERYGPSTGYC